MSLMLGSFNNGSSGPKPVISSRISETNSASSCVLSASRSTSTYCETSCWTWRRISSSGSFSSAERLISSIRRRCRRTLASSSLSLCSGLAACCCCAPGGGGGSAASGNTVQATPSSADGSSIADRSGAATRRAVKRPPITNVLSGDGELELLQERHGFALRRLGGVGLQHQLLELGGDLVARLDLVERHAAIDRLAHQIVVVGNGA